MSVSIWVFIIESFFSTWALTRVFHLHPGNIFTIFMFAGCFLFYKHVSDSYANTAGKNASTGNGDRLYRSIICSRILSVIFTLFYFLYDRDNYVEELSNRLFKAVMLAAVLVGLYFFFVYVLRFVFFYLTDPSFEERIFYKKADTCDEDGSETLKHKVQKYYSGHVFGCTFALCILFFLPYFLYQFPGIMTPDSIVQYEQALHIKPYSNHHPWLHTLLLELFYDFGFTFTRDPNISASFYTVAQMIFMAFCASYVVKTMQIKGFKPLICFLATLFYAIVPYNDVFAVTIWKDIPFAGMVALFVCSLIRLDSEKEHKVINIVTFLLSGVGFCLLRTNGLYAFIVLVPFLLVRYWKKSKTVVISTAAVLTVVLAFRFPIMNAFNVEQPDLVESLSIPVQQVASVIVNGGTVDEDSMYEIQKVVDLTYIDKLYDPTFADNIKELVRAGDQDYLRNNKLKFFKIYLKLGLRNPAEYLKAYVMQTYGYYYPDREYNVADAEGVVSSSLEFQTTPLIGGPLVIKSKEIFNKLGNMIPLYSVIWCMGAMFWVLLTGMAAAIIKGKKTVCVYYLPYLLLVLTILVATPVAAEFRYAYFLMFSIPLLFTAEAL
ncbi:MAG: DUF6020 family protein [Lachnospiraceae bacterium]|nr:DUF6020 family protein [Lachnospiraceae bacterium]